jgi:membrane-associated phospholipid phosphatase
MLRPRRGAAIPTVLACLLVLAAALPLDPVLHDLAFRYLVSHEVRLVSNGVTQLGTAWAASGLLGTVAVMAWRTADAGLLRASVGGLAGVAIASLATHTVKQVACRARPKLVDGWGVDVAGAAGAVPPDPATVGFFHWPCIRDSRYHSFPSGHAATAFAVAAALSLAVPGRRRVWLAVAGGVGLSRILLNAHFLSDVLGGALLGWWAGQAGVGLVTRLVAWWRRPVDRVGGRGVEERSAGAPSL